MPCCKWQASSFCWECTLPHVCPPHAGWCFLQFWFLLLTLLPLLSHPPIFTSCHHPISHTQSPPHPPSLLYLPGSVSLAVLVPSVHGMPASLTTPLPSFFLILCNNSCGAHRAPETSVDTNIWEDANSAYKMVVAQTLSTSFHIL